MKSEVLRETENKKLIFQKSAIGPKYIIRRRIKWISITGEFFRWEFLSAHDTLGEAACVYDLMNDLPVERDFEEWCEKCF